MINSLWSDDEVPVGGMVQLPLGGQLHQGVVERLFAGRGHVREGHDQGLPYGFDPRGPPLP